jgi:heme exporter protein A
LALLQGRELGVWRGERCLFESLDFELGSGQLALLIGPNGSGKTSLLRVLAGLAEPSSGVVTWNGMALAALAPDARAEIAYRGHLDAIKRELTVRENLEFHARIRGDRRALEPLLAEVKLARAADTRARYLSAGQRRRAALAMLRLSNARLWLLDEPMTNLDSDGRDLVGGWIEQHLRDDGIAVIATHQPEELSVSGALVIEL